MVKKRTFAKWGAVGICAIFALCLAGTIIVNYPFYPAFRKEMNTFDDLQKSLRNTPGVFLPDVSSEEFDGWEYVLRLDDRNIFSKPAGYECYGDLTYSGVEVKYGINCDQSVILHSERNIVYKDTEMYYFLNESQDDKDEMTLNIEFCAGNNHYYIYGIYCTELLSDRGVDSLNREIKLQMLQFAQDIIDGYLLQN